MPTKTLWRLVASHATTGNQRPLAHSRDLDRLMSRLARDGALWSRIGWQAWTLQDTSLQSVGYTATLREHVGSLHRQGHISRETYRRALACCPD